MNKEVEFIPNTELLKAINEMNAICERMREAVAAMCDVGKVASTRPADPIFCPAFCEHPGTTQAACYKQHCRYFVATYTQHEKGRGLLCCATAICDTSEQAWEQWWHLMHCPGHRPTKPTDE